MSELFDVLGSVELAVRVQTLKASLVVGRPQSKSSSVEMLNESVLSTPVKALTSKLLSTSLTEQPDENSQPSNVFATPTTTPSPFVFTKWAHSKPVSNDLATCIDDSDEVLSADSFVDDEGVSLVEDSTRRVDFLTCLPFEISVYILLFADIKSLCRAKTVSKAWYTICSDGLVWRDHFYRNQGWRIKPELLHAAIDGQDLTNAERDALARRSSPLPASVQLGTFSPKSFTSGSNQEPAFDWTSPSEDASPTPSQPSMTSRFGITRRLSTLMSDFSGSFTRANIAATSTSTRSSAAPFQSTRARSHSNTSLAAYHSPPYQNTRSRRVMPYLSPSGPMPSPFHSNSAALRLAPLRGLDWADLYKNRYLLGKRWLTGAQHTSVLRGHQDSVYCIQADRDKLISGSRDTTAKIWDLRTAKCKATLAGHRGSILTLQYDDKVLMTGSSDATVRIWDLVTFKCIQILKGHTMGVLDISFDDHYVVSCSKDLTIRVWFKDSGTLYRVLSGHRGPVNAARLKGNRILSASGDALLKLWDLETGEIIRVFAGHERGLACLAWSGDRVATGSNDRTIRVWDVNSGACLTILEGHGDLVRSLVFDGESDRIVSGSYDRTVRVWNASTGDQLVEFRKGHKSLVFDVTMDASRLISCSHDERILILDFGRGLTVDAFV